jgi:hypothetical protein
MLGVSADERTRQYGWWKDNFGSVETENPME